MIFQKEINSRKERIDFKKQILVKIDRENLGIKEFLEMKDIVI